MKLVVVFLSLLMFAFSLFAQTTDRILATTNNQNFTAGDLAPEAHQVFKNLRASVDELRKRLLEQQIVDVLLETEAAAQKTTAEKLVETQVNSKAQTPTVKEIQAVYDANRAAIGDRTLEEVRPQIVEFLKQGRFANYVSNLKTKYKVSPGR
ncbi:MAG: hypothetical protein H0U87_08235, partial [Acidobacteria bacterium]|nr:hypothetical protein [Acidobacteriota bacterium]